MAANLPLPKQIVAHGWWTIEGEKMSKSVGNVIAPLDLVNNYGLDQTRYFLMKAMPFGNDGDFSRDRVKEIVNADLANNIGNFAQRILSMIFKNLDGIIPEKNDNALDDETKKLFADLVYAVKTTKEIREGDVRFEQKIAEFNFYQMLNDLTAISSKCNEAIDKTEPWKLKNENPEKFKTTMYYFADAIRCIGIMLQPYCPEASEKLLDQLKIPASERSFAFINEDKCLKSGTKIDEPKGIFPRLI
jgi:methionyl-tRNA synthetase